MNDKSYSLFETLFLLAIIVLAAVVLIALVGDVGKLFIDRILWVIGVQ